MFAVMAATGFLKGLRRAFRATVSPTSRQEHKAAGLLASLPALSHGTDAPPSTATRLPSCPCDNEPRVPAARARDSASTALTCPGICLNAAVHHQDGAPCLSPSLSHSGPRFIRSLLPSAFVALLLRTPVLPLAFSCLSLLSLQRFPSLPGPRSLACMLIRPPPFKANGLLRTLGSKFPSIKVP